MKFLLFRRLRLRQLWPQRKLGNFFDFRTAGIIADVTYFFLPKSAINLFFWVQFTQILMKK